MFRTTTTIVTLSSLLFLASCWGAPFTAAPSPDAIIPTTFGDGDSGAPTTPTTGDGAGEDAGTTGADSGTPGDPDGAEPVPDAGHEADAGDSGDVAYDGGDAATPVDSGPPCISHTDGVGQTFCFDAPTGVLETTGGVYSVDGATAACQAYANSISVAGGACGPLSIGAATGGSCPNPTNCSELICFTVSGTCDNYCWAYGTAAYAGSVYACANSSLAGESWIWE
jgi:hypothetical protein